MGAGQSSIDFDGDIKVALKEKIENASPEELKVAVEKWNKTTSPSADDLIALCKKLKEENKYPDNLSIKNFDIDYYNKLPEDKQKRLLQCVRASFEYPDSLVGSFAMQPEDLETYGEFFGNVISQYHKVEKGSKHVNNWNLEGVEGLPDDGKLDVTKLGIEELSMRVRVGRNFKQFPLPGAMSAEDRKNMENKMCLAFEELIKDEKYGGAYHSLTPEHKNFIDATKYKELVDDHFMFKDMATDNPRLVSAGIASDWPIGRGCYISEDKQFIVWVCEEDHLRIICMNKKGTILNEVFDRLKGCLDKIESIEGLEFAKSDTYGYITSCPTNLGTGMRASVHVKIPNLTKDGTDKQAKAIAKTLGLSVRGLGGEHTPIGADGTVDISPSARFCITEAQIITALYKGIQLLMEEEKKAV